VFLQRWFTITSMIASWFKRKRQTAKMHLVIFGAEFGSYQFMQLVNSSSKYEVVGFISADSWQQRSGFGKIGVYTPEQLDALFDEDSIMAIVVTSDQRDYFEKSGEMVSVRSKVALVRHCEVLTIPQKPDREMADRYIDQLIGS
jgi:FlaA1/EpsC-like NDP-sugar epimerase